MASSAPNPPSLHGATAAPPPTPSALPSSSHLTTFDAADLLSGLLRRLPPSLSLPTQHRLSNTASVATSPLPTISFYSYGCTETDSAAKPSSTTRLGFFELTDHGIPTELALAAEADSFALFDLPHDHRESYFPRNWPIGYEPSDESDDGDNFHDSFCFDSQCSTEPTLTHSLSLTSLREFTRRMEQVGLQVVEWLLRHVVHDNPARKDPTRLCSLMWVSRGSSPGHSEHTSMMPVGSYPHVVCLSYQIRHGQKLSLVADSGRVLVVPKVGSIIVTIGDIAQVWSNGKLKKVRGRPVPVPSSDSRDTTMLMSLLITLPLESMVAPLTVVPGSESSTDDVEVHQEGEAVSEEETKPTGDVSMIEHNKAVFSSFPFEDYAWGLYHERLSFKDPLDRYRI